MAKIAIEIISSQGLRRDLRIFDKDSVSIGRGYNNDLILQDEFISASHAVISALDEGLLNVEDQKSRNGIFVLGQKGKPNAKKKIFQSMQVESGLKLILGNTIIRVFHADHPVAPAKSISFSKLSSFSVNRKITTWFAILGFLLLYMLDSSTHNYYVESSAVSILFAEFLALCLFSIWSGIWTLIGKTIRHRARFRVHITLLCIFAIILLPIKNFCEYFGYIFADARIEIFSSMILYSIALATLLFGHMSYATLIKPKVRIVTSIMIPILICTLLTLGYISLSDKFSPSPRYYARLKPPIIQPVKVYEIDDFITKLGDTFKTAEEKKKGYLK